LINRMISYVRGELKKNFQFSVHVAVVSGYW